jgi:hypothetical protein
LHRHSELEELPGGELEFDGHAVQIAEGPNEPSPVLKVFAAHILHATAVLVQPGHSYPSLQ